MKILDLLNPQKNGSEYIPPLGQSYNFESIQADNGTFQTIRTAKPVNQIINSLNSLGTWVLLAFLLTIPLTVLNALLFHDLMKNVNGLGDFGYLLGAFTALVLESMVFISAVSGWLFSSYVFTVVSVFMCYSSFARRIAEINMLPEAERLPYLIPIYVLSIFIPVAISILSHKINARMQLVRKANVKASFK
ncbi:hypothetical protein [Flexithrix dorotheae]|uniref:hypothetical protein n=1 Tax=Flexithrix dorotheae TaxID=70993 RepID=UPI00037BFDE9|nr:hypothetical protein [Flexithrix dorotheae]